MYMFIQLAVLLAVFSLIYYYLPLPPPVKMIVLIFGVVLLIGWLLEWAGMVAPFGHRGWY